MRSEGSSKGPFTKENGRPHLVRCAVAYLDLLGFRAEMERAYRTGTAEALLEKLDGALTPAMAYLDGNDTLGGGHPLWQLKAFTDNIVIGFPAGEPDAEGELGHLMFSIARFQLEMIRKGFFVRGGLAVGGLYMDDHIVFGDALIEAYYAESTAARDPRVVLAPSAVEAVRYSVRAYGGVEHSPHDRVLLRDADGQIFLSYLDVTVASDDPDVPPDRQAVREHRDMVKARLEEFQKSPPVWTKYAWVAAYHNFFCRDSEEFDESYLIASPYLHVAPTRLRERGI